MIRKLGLVPRTQDGHKGRRRGKAGKSAEARW